MIELNFKHHVLSRTDILQPTAADCSASGERSGRTGCALGKRRRRRRRDGGREVGEEEGEEEEEDGSLLAIYSGHHYYRQDETRFSVPTTTEE